MRIAIFSICRDRLAYTQECFDSLRQNAGLPFDHYVVDNGSQDGTVEWLRDTYKPHWMCVLPENHGISIASNLALREILAHDYSLIIKADNDCLVTTPGILEHFVKIYAEPEASRWALSPRVTGINRQPTRAREHMLVSYRIGVTAIIGGLFHVLPGPLYREFFMEAGGYDEALPKAKGQDDQLMEWLRARRYNKGYVEDISVAHFRGTDQQAREMPDYFTRKWLEETQTYGSKP